MENNADKEFIEKISDVEKFYAEKLSSIYKLIFAVSFFLIVISQKIVTVTENINIEWITIGIKLDYLVIFMSFILLVLQQYNLSLFYEYSLLGNAIGKYFKHRNPDRPKSILELTSYPEFLGIIIATTIYRETKIGHFIANCSVFIVVLIFLTLPIFAQISAFMFLLEMNLVGWKLTTAYGIALLLESILLYSFLKFAMKEK